MNLQGVTVIFVIIFLPIILVSSFYIQQEVDTITTQTSYDTKLIDATTDAVSAFEINTANEDLSAISDSLRSIIEASNNVFITTLATNLGMSGASQNKILPYIPAIVYTLYDGFYIYAPVQSPKVLVDTDGVYVRVGDPGVELESGHQYKYNPDPDSQKTMDFSDSSLATKGFFTEDFGKILYCSTANIDTMAALESKDEIECTTDPDSAYFTTSYILKSFIPYSMQYKSDGEYDVTINYTLENYISVSGTIKKAGKDIYYTKSGYLINPDYITKITLGDYVKDSTKDDFAGSKEIILGGYTESTVALDDVDKLVDNCFNTDTFVSVEFNNGVIIDATTNSNITTTSTGTKINDSVSAIKYYIKAYIFSCWVRDNLGDINESDIPKTSKELQADFNVKQNGFSLDDDLKLFYSYGDSAIFKTNDSWNINDTDSNFIEHKRKVIKNAIQYNLNLAMAVYNAGQGDEYYQMPILSDVEWDKLMSNVSVLAFMQGFPCGLKTYNNYALVTSTNNEFMTNVDDIYYIPIEDENLDGVLTSESSELDKRRDLDICHKIDCVDDDWINGAINAKYFQSFPSKDVKYDKVYDYTTNQYVFDHVAKNCYYCIVNSNYGTLLKDAMNELESNKNNVDNLLLGKGIDSEDFIKKLLNAQYIAIGKIRNNTYKSVAYETNYGIRTEEPNNNITVTESLFESDTFENSSNPPKLCYGNNSIIKDFELNNCKEIAVTINVTKLKNYNPIYMYLGSEKVGITASGETTVYFKNPKAWKDKEIPITSSDSRIGDYTFTVDNGDFSEGDLFVDCNHSNSIIDNKVTIKSITYKYK